MKVSNSWTKLDDSMATPSRKKVDCSMIRDGVSIIPILFRKEFPCTKSLEYTPGKEKVKIILIYHEREYDGQIDVEPKGRMRIWIKDKELKEIIRNTFSKTYEYIEAQKEIQDKKNIIVPDELAEYLEFYRTDNENVYKIDFVTRGDLQAQQKEEKQKMDIGYIYKYIEKKGYEYLEETIANFYLSLKTKPFVILSGISGTGKSKLVQLFAEAIGAQFELIPVRPDWSDATELLGYSDLNQVFHPGRLTCIIEEAHRHLEKPYIVCLDEMNLARVEYYLSDFLSIIESRTLHNGSIVTRDLWVQQGEEGLKLCLPENLYIVGTVNMDETTFQFSKKVLDRANTIELSEVDLSYDFDREFEETPSLVVANAALKSEFLLLKDCSDYKELALSIIETLKEINEILMPCGLQFAYRVRDEIIFYMIYNAQEELLSQEEAFDYQLLQKVLPRINGTSMQLRQVMLKLSYYCLGQTYTQGMSEEIEVLEKKQAVYPKSYKKLLQMLRRYEEDGFTSFWF